MRAGLRMACAGALLLVAAPVAPARTETPAAQPASEEAQRAFWQERALMLERRVQEARERYEAALAAYSRSQAHHRVRGDEKRALLEEREAAREALREAERTLEDLPDEARRAGVPPGWIRLFDDGPAAPQR